MGFMVDVIPLIAIPLVILAHWQRVSRRYRDTGELPRYGSTEHFRMTDRERLAALVGTLALLVYVAVVVGRGDKPNVLAAAAAALFVAYLGLDFYVGLRYPERRPRP
jgi:phosphoglycerol transferase MdoB-like AlkP superfamily enzyme